MIPTFNRNCFNCRVATTCNQSAAEAIGEVAAHRTNIEVNETALNHLQQSYQIMQNLEATGLPGEVDQGRALVKDVAGIELPSSQHLFFQRQKIEDLEVSANQAQSDAEDAVRKNDELMRECPGPRSIRLGKFYVALCRGSSTSFFKGIFFPKTRP